MAQQFMQSMVQKLPSACIVDTTAPVFAGIQTATTQLDGSFLVTWAVATDSSGPMTYEIYCLPGVLTAAQLFAVTPKQLAKASTSALVFVDSNGARLAAGPYSLGVRARDSLGNANTNVVVLVATTTGILTETQAEFIKVVKAALANATTNLESTIYSDEVTSKLEANEIVSKVTVDPDIKC